MLARRFLPRTWQRRAPAASASPPVDAAAPPRASRHCFSFRRDQAGKSRRGMKRTSASKGLPTLTTERLVLRPWRKADLEAFAALNADPQVMVHFPALLSEQESAIAAARIATHIE